VSATFVYVVVFAAVGCGVVGYGLAVVGYPVGLGMIVVSATFVYVVVFTAVGYGVVG
jgi:hypothetical protein